MVVSLIASLELLDVSGQVTVDETHVRRVKPTQDITMYF